MEQITIEKKLYLVVGIILALMIVTIDLGNIGLNKTVGFAFDIKNFGKQICLISLGLSFIVYFILAILGYKTIKSLSILYVVIAFVNVYSIIFLEYPMITLILSSVSIIISAINVIMSIKAGK
jgi:hypothetical protein